MATQQKFVDFIIEQIDIPEQISYKKMFGEYGLYFGNKMFALVCDHKLFIKQTLSGREYINDVVEEAPYTGAKPCFLIEEKIEDSIWLRKLVEITVKELPAPKVKKKQKHS